MIYFLNRRNGGQSLSWEKFTRICQEVGVQPLKARLNNWGNQPLSFCFSGDIAQVANHPEVDDGYTVQPIWENPQFI
jgi:hypothetical protein